MSSSEYSPFQWIENARIYQVFIDRFAGFKKNYTQQELKNGFVYGNLKALITKLDYIRSLKFNMIWITPFYVNQPNGYHGYHILNFNHVDPRFAYGEKILDNNIGDPFDPNDVKFETGADLVLKELIKECHRRDMGVMMDLVPNHVYKTHPYFLDASKSVNSKYRNWFYWVPKNASQNNKGIADYYYLSFLYFGDLPKLNLENKDCFNYVVNSTKKFLAYGIDAVRVDHCIGPTSKSIKKIAEEIHKFYPNVPFIGEILPFFISKSAGTVFGVPKDKLVLMEKVTLESIKVLDEVILSYNGVLDGALDFSFQFLVDMFVSGRLSEQDCIKEIEKHFERFSKNKNFILVKNIDSHDTDRIMFKCKNNIGLLKKAMELLYKKFNQRNDPLVVYYGTEDFMSQERTIIGEPYGDFRCREPMHFGFQWMKTFFKEKTE